MSQDGSFLPVPLLEMRSIRKSFSGAAVVRDVDFRAWPGELHALMGENGAGKSTLMKILAGIVKPDAGEIVFGGRLLVARTPGAVLRNGIVLIHQELNLVSRLTVAENIFLGAEWTHYGGWLDRAGMNAAAAKLLASLHAEFAATALVGELSIAEQQLVEIARALRHQTRLLIMDEPTSTLSQRETEQLFALVERLRMQGTAIIYITHRMAEVQRLADRVTVLRDGALAGTLGRGELDPRQIIRLMVGRSLLDFHRQSAARPRPGCVVLRAQAVSDGRRVHGVDLEVHEGEVLGLTGLVGAGRTEFARLIFGAERTVSGRVELAGALFSPRSPAAAIAAGVAYVPEDRKKDGLFLQLSAATNLTINIAGPTARSGVVRGRYLREHAARVAADFGVRVASLAVPARLLSGGNQQKLLLGRWLTRNLRLLILDEPTRGVDVGAKGEIYRLIDGFAAEGMTVLMISSELPEIIALCDRVAVMREGRVAGVLDRDEGDSFTQEAMMALATGATLPTS